MTFLAASPGAKWESGIIRATRTVRVPLLPAHRPRDMLHWRGVVGSQASIVRARVGSESVVGDAQYCAANSMIRGPGEHFPCRLLVDATRSIRGSRVVVSRATRDGTRRTHAFGCIECVCHVSGGAKRRFGCVAIAIPALLGRVERVTQAGTRDSSGTRRRVGVWCLDLHWGCARREINRVETVIEPLPVQSVKSASKGARRPVLLLPCVGAGDPSAFAAHRFRHLRAEVVSLVAVSVLGSTWRSMATPTSPWHGPS